MKSRIVSLALVPLLFVSAANGDSVADWNSAALNAIRLERTAPPRASRALAILHVAIYDAVNGIVRTHHPYLVAGQVPASASVEAAVAAAGHHVLASLFPGQSATFDALYQDAILHIPSRPQREFGLEWGRSVATEVLAARAQDGAVMTMPVPVSSGPGDWMPTPPAFAPYLMPHWAFIAPFCMTSNGQFRPTGPPGLSTAEYAMEVNEVKLFGAATNSARSAEQSQIALFWADGAGTETPPGHWNTIAQTVSASVGLTLSENARLFALLNLALADAAICSWDAKYHFNRWRPVTAIRLADTDGNPATDPDPTWSSFIVTPPFPDYVSGHSTFSGAAATVLALFFGTDTIPFVAKSDALAGVQRRFPSFSAAAEEAAVSRLYGGIHFRSANEHGMQGGLSIGSFVMANFLLPKSNRARID